MAEKHRDGIHQLTFEDIFGPEFGADDQKTTKSGKAAVKAEKKASENRSTKENRAVNAKKKAVLSDTKKTAAKPDDRKRRKTTSAGQLAVEEKKQKEPVPKRKRSATAVKEENDDIISDTDMHITKQPAVKKAKAEKGTVTETKPAKKAAYDKVRPVSAPDDDNEAVVFQKETPCQFSIGESVSLKYSGKLFTVLSIDGNTVRCVQTEGEPMECTMACSDLKHSDKPARRSAADKTDD